VVLPPQRPLPRVIPPIFETPREAQDRAGRLDSLATRVEVVDDALQLDL
jgi:hypothetical protein